MMIFCSFSPKVEKKTSKKTLFIRCGSFENIITSIKSNWILSVRRNWRIIATQCVLIWENWLSTCFYFLWQWKIVNGFYILSHLIARVRSRYLCFKRLNDYIHSYVCAFVYLRLLFFSVFISRIINGNSIKAIAVSHMYFYPYSFNARTFSFILFEEHQYFRDDSL